MALLGNYSVLNKTAGRWIAGNSSSVASGVAANGPAQTRANFNRNNDWRKFNWVDQSGAAFVTLVKTAAKPRGYYGSGCYALPSVAGEMSMYATGSCSVTANLFAGRLMEVSLSGSGDFTASAALVASMVAALTGSGGLAASIVGLLNASASMTGSGDMSASATGIANPTASLTGSGGLAAAIAALGSMSVNMTVVGTGLTVTAIVDGVWNANAASYNTSGTMGQKLNSAGGSADPLTNPVPGSYAPGTAGFVLGTNLDAAVSSRASALVQTLIEKMLRNRTVTDPTTGIITVYDDDNTTVLFQANIYQDANGTIPYSGNGVNRRDRLT